MKKIVVFLFSVLMVMVVAVGCSSSNESNAKSEKAATSEEKADSNTQEISEKTPSVTYKDGTYEGTSDSGMHPGLKVSVVVKNGKIGEVTVVEHGETEGIGTQAIEKLPAQIVEAQSVEVDSVSGASLSSKAILEAVGTALSQAK